MAKRIERQVLTDDDSILKRITPVGEVDKFLSMLVYGQQGKGKTVFGCTFPKPLLLIDIREKGYDSVVDVEGVDVLNVDSWDQFEEAYWLLEGGKSKYKSVVVDQLTGLQALGIDTIKAQNGQKPSDVFSMRSYGRLGGMMQTWVYNYRELVSRGIHVCFIAHERRRDAEETDDDRVAPEVGASLTQSIASYVNGAVSVIGNSFVREHYDKKTKKRTYEFCMRLGPHAFYAAKIRRPVSAGPMPDVITDPSFTKVMALSKGETLKRGPRKL